MPIIFMELLILQDLDIQEVLEILKVYKCYKICDYGNLKIQIIKKNILF